jgi:hypothetical protein
MAEAGFQQSFPSTIDIPLAGSPLQRATGTTDQRFVNVLFEKIKNPLTGGDSYYLRKRFGLLNHTRPSGGDATGRGIYAWEGSGKIYSVFDNKIWSDTTDLGVTLAGSSGRVWFTETSPTSSTRLLIVSDGADNYNITTADGITQIDQTDDADYPQSNLGPVVFFDDYVFQAQEDGDIWNTDPDDFDTWLSTSLIPAGMYGDELVAIARMKDQIVAFGKFSTEFFFNNQNPVGSPLLRIDQNALQIGLASKTSLAWSADTMMWVSEAPAQGQGGRSVWKMEGLSKVVSVSTPIIDRFLNAEGTSITSCSAWMEVVDGHLLYVLNLSGADRTFVYDVDMNQWSEWSNTGTAKFPGAYATSKDGVTYIQDATNGRIYKLDPATYQDSESNFTVTVQTDNYDFGSPFNKFQDGLWVVGDNTTGTLNVTETDDDYANFNSTRPIDMTQTSKYLSQGGSFQRRAYKLTYTENAALRLSKLVLKLRIGNG